jgi:hypothetical protein
MSKQPRRQPTTKSHPKPTKEELHEFELAGGVEGGMPAGLASGPNPSASVKASKKPKKPDK